MQTWHCCMHARTTHRNEATHGVGCQVTTHHVPGLWAIFMAQESPLAQERDRARHVHGPGLAQKSPLAQGRDRVHDPEKRDMQGARATKGYI
jgi:hypothetical protein